MRTLMSPNSLCRNLIVPVILSFCLQGAVAQRDPISNFCRRWGHQSAVVDDKLYIDGGLITWNPEPQKPENFSNPYFIYHDLGSVSRSGMPPPYANLSKNSSIPSVNGGVFWPDEVNKRIYLFGGEYFDETPWDFSLYAYDIINDQWDNFGAPPSPSIKGLSYGAGLSISSRGEGYYYGGWMNNATDAGWGDGPGIPTSYMLRYDMDSNTWDNTTGPDNVGRAEGVMVYIPAGDGGLIIYFGGIRGTGNGTWDAQPMEEIVLYDVLSSKTYVQNATGDVPESRRRFCAGAAWAEDQSSYNIYLYGGLGEATGSLGFDDVYILTLPTFTWIRMYPNNTNGTGDYPHHSMSCNVVNNAQMIIHGGFFPAYDKCDSEDQWGLHNLDLGRQNKDRRPWELYQPNKTSYAVPDDVIKVVGGGRDGGATKTAPEDGYSHQDLQVLMTRKASVANRQPTRAVPGPDDGSDKGRGLSTGAIVGIAVGGAIALLAVLIGCFCLVRRYRRNRSGKGSQTISQQYDYHHPSYPSGSSNQFSQGPWSPQSSHFTPASPPPFSPRPQTVPPHTGPPVELPADGNSEVARPSPYSDAGSSGEPKYDAQGNAWIPQVSMVQVPGLSQRPDEESTLPPPPPLPAANTLKYNSDPVRAQSPQELDNELERRTSEGTGPASPTHLTYYHP